ncbi:conserved hypothetical protein [Neospora caninum Liverpool]|uniref:DUSP domain-containing protein n=1 Tax=Neospora caninum (strain Liverpool) TaxID=572307 RepID=F0V8J0_NEOCL|nr:conserved hypothetical protein [Neospora caninum Liverpool]CBZ50031.1 conserved hypothetical protein [Neospora caninum Liverpool]CEL64621.1 TPA: hypothetical protein BN1204_005070 [Neospora caninum Liverpool]|eukprot:XP_003880066.1 conserved hypothetical protein [Neospora caninum Liverpool]
MERCRNSAVVAVQGGSRGETSSPSPFVSEKEALDRCCRSAGDATRWQADELTVGNIQELRGKSRGVQKRDDEAPCQQPAAAMELRHACSRGEAQRQAGDAGEGRQPGRTAGQETVTAGLPPTRREDINSQRGKEGGAPGEPEDRNASRLSLTVASDAPGLASSSSIHWEKETNGEDHQERWGEAALASLSEASLNTAVEVYVHSRKDVRQGGEGKPERRGGDRISRKARHPSFDWLGDVAQRVEGSFHRLTSSFADFALKAEEIFEENFPPPRPSRDASLETPDGASLFLDQGDFLEEKDRTGAIDVDRRKADASASCARTPADGTENPLKFSLGQPPSDKRRDEREKSRGDGEKESTVPSWLLDFHRDLEAHREARRDGEQETAAEEMAETRAGEEASARDSSETQERSGSSAVLSAAEPRGLSRSGGSPREIEQPEATCLVFLPSCSRVSDSLSSYPPPARSQPKYAVLPPSLLFPGTEDDSPSSGKKSDVPASRKGCVVSRKSTRQPTLNVSGQCAWPEAELTETFAEANSPSSKEAVELDRPQATPPGSSPVSAPPHFTEEEITLWSSTKCSLCGRQVLQDDLERHSEACNVAASVDEYSIIHEDKFLASASAMPKDERSDYIAERRLEEALEGLCLVRRWGCDGNGADCLRSLQATLEQKLQEVRSLQEARRQRRVSRATSGALRVLAPPSARVCCERGDPPRCSGDLLPLAPASPRSLSSSILDSSPSSDAAPTSPDESLMQRSPDAADPRRPEAPVACLPADSFSDLLIASDATSPSGVSAASALYHEAFAGALASLSLPGLSSPYSSRAAKPCRLSHASPSSPSSSASCQPACEEKFWWMPGTFGFVVDSAWMRAWLGFIGLATPSVADGLLELRLHTAWDDPSFYRRGLHGGRPPGPITNKTLLDVDGKILAGRQHGLNAHYLILDASAWTFLFRRYGGGPPIILYNPHPCEFGDLYEACLVTFEGEWQNGHPYTGAGRAFDPLCNRGFDGELREGRLWTVKPGSKGVLPDGGILLGGGCVRGKIHGPNGKLLRRRKLYVGEFRKGKLHGRGLVARAEDGVVLAEGLWENGQLCGI